MPFYTDLSSLYGTSSNSYSAPYLSGPYSGHSSIIASNFTRPTASFGKPSSRGFTGRNYKPHLATITETHSIIPRSIPRINPPSLLLHTSPKYKIQKPISINTADIDVSINKYRKFERPSKPIAPLLKFDRKPHTDMTKPSSDDSANDTFMPRIDPDTRSTIKRQRTVVRIHTDHNAPANKQNTTPPSFKPKWRENFEPSELTVTEKKTPMKTPGAKLVEKFLIRDRTIKEENEQKNRIRAEKLDKYDDGNKARRSVKRKSSIQKTPSFHDICKTISSDKINEDLNPVHTILEQRRQSKIYSDEKVLKEIRRNSAEILQEQVLMLDEMLRKQNDTETASTPEESGQKTNKEGEDTDEDEKSNSDYNSRGSIKRKKKITKKKSNEKVILPPEDEEEMQSSLCRRPVLKKTRRSSTTSSLGSVIEDSPPYDKETEQAYQDAIRDISHGDVEKIEVKNKSSPTPGEQKLHLKAFIEDIQVEDTPKARKKFAINYTVEEFDEKLKNIQNTPGQVAKSNFDNNDTTVLKLNLQNMLFDSAKSKSLKINVDSMGVLQNAKAKDVMTSNMVQKQPIVGRKGKILKEKVAPIKKAATTANAVNNREVNNNNIDLHGVQLNNRQVIQDLDNRQKEAVFAKQEDSNINKKSETLENLANTENLDKKSHLLSKSKSVKDLELHKLNEAKDEKELSELKTTDSSQLTGEVKQTKDVSKEADDELEFSVKIIKQGNKTEPLTSSKNTATSHIIESKDICTVGAQETKNADKNKSVLTSIKAPDVCDSVNHIKPQSVEKTKLLEKQLNKQTSLTAKVNTDKVIEDADVEDFWSSVDPEENTVITRELFKAQHEKYEAIKWKEESQRLEELERAKEEERKKAEQLAEEEEKSKHKLAKEEEIVRQKLAEYEEIRRRKLAEEEEKRRQKLVEDEEKRQQKLAEEERKLQQKLKEEEELKRKQAEEKAQRVKLAQEEEKKKQQLKEEELKRRRAELEEQHRKLVEEAEKRKQKLEEAEEKRKQKQQEEEARKAKAKLLKEETRKRKQVQEELNKQKLLDDCRKRKQAEEANRKREAEMEEANRQREAALEEERAKEEEEEYRRMVSKRSLVTKYNTVQDPDLAVFQVPEEPEPQPQEEEPKPEETSGGFVPLQSNRFSQFMIPFQKPEHFDECPVVIMATPKDIRKRHYPKPRVTHLPTPALPSPPPPPPTVVEEEEDEDDDDEETEEGTEEEEEGSSSGGEYAVERSGADIGKSTSSTDSGFDSSAPGSPANRRHNG